MANSKFESKSKFVIKEINVCTSWRHNLPLNNDCTICRHSLNEDSVEFQNKGITSYVVVGECGHAFHRECLVGWIKDHPRCPICSSKWVYQKKKEMCCSSSGNNSGPSSPINSGISINNIPISPLNLQPAPSYPTSLIP